MKCTLVFLLLVLYLLATPANAQKTGYFARQALIGVEYGADRDWEGEWNNRFEVSQFWGARAGISLTRRLYAGIRANLVRARNFETDAQSFYMAGAWGRWYFIQPFFREKPGRWGLYAETGLLTGNFSFDNVDFIEYYVQRPGQWYIPAAVGGEFRVWQNLTLTFGVQLYYTAGKSWDQYGIAYPSLGLNWLPGI